MSNSKFSRVLLISFSAILSTIGMGVINLFVSHAIINNFGSDFNGVNSTATQLINLLAIFEGGVSIATSVSLFSPLSINDNLRISSIICSANRKFKKISSMIFVVGIVCSILYACIVDSAFSKNIIFIIFSLTVISSVIRIRFSLKYQVLLQSDQKEYIVNFLYSFFMFFSQMLVLFIVMKKFSVGFIRVVLCGTMIFYSIVLALYCNKKYPLINFHMKHSNEIIEGSKDIVISKFVGLLYSAFPIFAISIFIGTKQASVFAIYNSIFSFVKGIENAIVNAPKMVLGNLLIDSNRNYICDIFKKYESFVVFSIFYIICVLSVIIVPFLILYTKGVTDINYLDNKLVLFFILIALIEIIHIPSGNIINMSGNFRKGKQIQIIAGIVLIFSLIFSCIFKNLYSIMASILLTALILAILEIGFVHYDFFNIGIKKICTLIFIFLLTSIFLYLIEVPLTSIINSYNSFLFFSMLISISNFIFFSFIYYLFDKDSFMFFFNKLKTNFAIQF